MVIRAERKVLSFFDEKNKYVKNVTKFDFSWIRGEIMEKIKERIAFLKKRLEMYYEAEEKILQGQSYTIGSRTLTRTSLANVQSKIKELESEISALETRGNSKRRSVRVVPLG